MQNDRCGVSVRLRTFIQVVASKIVHAAFDEYARQMSEVLRVKIYNKRIK